MSGNISYVTRREGDRKDLKKYSGLPECFI